MSISLTLQLAARIGELLRHFFKVDKEVVEVPRVVGVGGQAVLAASTLDLQMPITGYDAVVADDGMWTRETIVSLSKLLTKHGARRILAVPLLSRCELREIDNLSHVNPIVSSQEYHQKETKAELAYALPLIYPVSFYLRGVDPFDQMRRKLSKYLNSHQPLNEIASNLLRQLDYVGRQDARRDYSDEFRETFVDIRAHFSLALESRSAVEILINKLSTIDSQDSLMACVTLFLQEWNLVKQFGMRQLVLPSINNLANRALAHTNCTPELTIETLSLIRVLMPSDYGHAISVANSDHLGNSKNYMRICFHLITLSSLLQQSNIIKTVINKLVSPNILEGALIGVNEKNKEKVFECTRLLGGLLIGNNRKTSEVESISVAIDLLTNFYRSGARTHTLNNLTNTLLFNTTNDQKISLQQDNYWREFLVEWEKAIENLQTTVIAAFNKLGPALANIYTEGEIIQLPTEVSYFCEHRNGTSEFNNDLTQISVALKLHLKNANSTRGLSSMIDRTIRIITKRIVSNVIEDESIAKRLYDQLAPTSLKVLLSNLEKNIAFGLGMNENQVTVSPSLREYDDPNLKVALPKFLRKRIETMIISNLQKHAFKEAIEPLNRVDITVRKKESNNNAVCIIVRNNGASVGKSKFRKNSKEVLDIIRSFGGNITEVIPSEAPNWVCGFEWEMETVRNEPSSLTRRR